MQSPDVWPFAVMLPLVHRTRLDDSGSPLCGLLARGHGSRLYLANVCDFTRSELHSQKEFERALRGFESVAYISFAAIIGDGWRID